MSQNNLDDDLTTDAIPSPPRDETKINDENTEEGNFNNSNSTGPNVTNSYKKTKAKGYPKVRKTSPTAAFASVININNANGIHIGSNYNLYLNNKSEKEQKKEQVVTEDIKILFNSTQLVNRKDLIFISQHLNEEWRLTARTLDYSDGQISQFYEDYIRSGIKEVIYQLLLDWIQNEADTAIVGRLANALWQTNQQDVVKRWAQNLNTSKT